MKKLILLAVCLCFLSASAQVKLPETKTVDSTDTYFGVTYKDPYRWLEHIKDSSVTKWFKQEADFSKFTLNNISGRDELIAEWKKLDKVFVENLVLLMKNKISLILSNKGDYIFN